MKIAQKIKVNWIKKRVKDPKILAFVSNLKDKPHYRDEKQLDLYYLKARIIFKMERGF